MGSLDNLRPPFDSETGRENQPKSVESRKRNRAEKKSITDTVKKQLDTVVKDPKQLAVIEKSGLPVGKKPTYKDFMVASIIMRTIQKGRASDLKEFMEIVGETQENIDIEDSDAYFEAAEMEGKE